MLMKIAILYYQKMIKKNKDDNADDDDGNTNTIGNRAAGKKNVVASKYYVWYSYVVMIFYVINCILRLLVLIEFNNARFGDQYKVLLYVSLSFVVFTQTIYLARVWFYQLKLFGIRRNGQAQEDKQTWYHILALVLLSFVCSIAIPVLLYFPNHKHSRLRLKYLVKLEYINGKVKVFWIIHKIMMILFEMLLMEMQCIQQYYYICQ